MIKDKPDGRIDKDYGFICHTINIIGASDVGPYSSPVPRVGLVQAFSLNILQERLRGIMRRVCCPSRNSGVPVQPQRATRYKISQIRQRFMPRL